MSSGEGVIYMGMTQQNAGCIWYGRACSEKNCCGDGFVNCKVRTRGVVSNKIEGEYRRIRSKASENSQVHCLSFLETKVASGSSAQRGISA